MKPQARAGAAAADRVVVGAGRSMMTDEALAQFAAAAALPGCVRAAAMPDLHPGRGIPVGAAFAVEGTVHPHLVGSDAGCGARLVCTGLDRLSRDRTERKLRRSFAGERPLLGHLDESPARDLFAAVWRDGPRGLLSLADLPDLLADLCRAEPADDGLPPSAPPPLDGAASTAALGTLGGGNHFAEIGAVDEVADAGLAGRLGLASRAVTVLVHSGSRGIGDALAARWRGRALAGDEVGAYLGELAGACRFARTNRLLLAWRVLGALGASRIDGIHGQLDIVHNDVRAERLGSRQVWVHRKGVAPAHEDQPTVVLGSRGAPSWIMMGLGSEATLRSVAHGAGRRMSRGEARSRLKERYRKAELARSSIGNRVICDDAALLYEEHPDAYKPIAPVLAALEESGCARRIASVTPLLTVKL